MKLKQTPSLVEPDIYHEPSHGIEGTLRRVNPMLYIPYPTARSSYIEGESDVINSWHSSEPLIPSVVTYDHLEEYPLRPTNHFQHGNADSKPTKLQISSLN